MLTSQTNLNSFVSIELTKDAVKHTVQILARTKPVDVVHQWRTIELSTQPCAWTNHWWAMAIQWLCGRKRLSKLVPYPIECLAFASEVCSVAKTHTLPERVIDSIHAQIADIMMNHQDPLVILVGYEAKRDLIDSLNFSLMGLAHGYRDDGFHYSGYPVVMTPKLTSDSVLVIPKT